MPFAFTHVCDLLEELEEDWVRKRHRKDTNAIVRKWFNRHQRDLKPDKVDRCALLSTLLPEKRTDRVYDIQIARLQRIFARALSVGASREAQLKRWQVSGSGVDLADCIADIVKQTPGTIYGDWPTIEEIDKNLHGLAATKKYSSPAVRSSVPPSSAPLKAHDVLGDIYRSLSPRDAKWFTRLILKNYKPVLLPEWMVYTCCDELLPVVLKIYDNFADTLRLLDEHQRSRGVLDGVLHKADITKLLKPQVGIKIGRQSWIKARSIKHCLEMGSGEMSCEKKYDGEYCQIHIDLSKGEDDCIQIFSKSGKDSTKDRVGLHGAIRSSLGFGTSSCKFRKRCILEGELVIYSDNDQKILGFEKIRKHVTRSGSRIGTARDSQAHDYEHLMIVYFDLILVDDDSLLNVKHSERLRRLVEIVHCQTGRAALVERQIINFSSRHATAQLREAFGSSIIRREEGLVIKPDKPYFDFSRDGRSYGSSCLKLKKGYIKGLGEVGDFAVVGARYDATRAKDIGMPNVKWTHFYLGCLINKDEVKRWGEEKPLFKVINEIELSFTMLKGLMKYAFPYPVKFDENDKIALEVPWGIAPKKRIDIVFINPLVFEMVGDAFHKDSNTQFWGLRFSYAKKIHFDRTWKDCISFDELQELAESEMNCPEMDDSQELATWIQALEDVDPLLRDQGQSKGKGRKVVAIEVESDTQQTSTTVDSVASLYEPRSWQKPQRAVYKDPATSAYVSKPATTDFLTPLTSSALNSPSSVNREEQPTSSVPRSSQKRRREPSQGSPQMNKQVRQEAATNFPTTRSRDNPRDIRSPLQDITQKSSSQSNVLPAAEISQPRTNVVPGTSQTEDPSISLVEVPLPLSVISASVDEHMRDTPVPSTHPSNLMGPKAPTLECPPRDTSPCRYASDACALTNWAILLSPCIAMIPLLTENLLPDHGAKFFTDIVSWHASASARATFAHNRVDPRTRTSSEKLPRPRRLILVEHCRSKATKAFLKQLERDPLRDRHGKHIMALVCDWRLLESITAEEAKHRLGGQGVRMEELCRRPGTFLGFV